MQKNIFSKSTWTHISIVLIIIIISLSYFYPQLEGKVLQQSDIIHFKAASKELVDFRERTGKEALWTDSMFGGMPGYLISVRYPGNITSYFQEYLRKLFHPASMLMMYLLGFYILLVTLGIKKWLSLVGAIAFGFSSYFLIIIGVGHNTKAYAIGYMAPMIAGILMVFRGKQIPGLILFSVALSLNLLAGHLQISYYAFILIAILAIIEFVYAVKEKRLPWFAKSIGILIIGGIIGVGMNFSRLYTTYQYSKKTIRGPSELTTGSEDKTSGLPKSYILDYSLGIDETLTLLIPDFMGGGTQTNPGINSESYRALQEHNINARQSIQGVSMYRGDQPIMAGPVYLGAIVVFLFVLALFIVKGRIKWWLVIAVVLSIMLAWGKNFMVLTDLFLRYMPMYNKFRAPTIMLVLVEFCVPLLAFIGLSKILTGGVEKKELLNGLKWAFIITGGFTLLFAILPGIAGSFSSPFDAARKYPDWLLTSMADDRRALLRSDAFRSFIFIALAAAALYGWQMKKLKTNLFIGIIGALILFDLWSVDRRYLNANDFETKRLAENPYPEMPVDKAILQDKDLSYRVLPLPLQNLSDPFSDARASYFHKNVGGYHAAKLRRYQDLIEHCISPETYTMIDSIRAQKSLNSIVPEMPVINMLNTRYFIYNLNQPPLRNPGALGNAWFVSGYKLVKNADQEIAALNNFNPANTAIIDQRFSKYVEGKTFTKDTSGYITLTDYQPNDLKYNFEAATEQLTVFSEIYYAQGWRAYIDDKEAPIFRVNYVLRAMVIPGGTHSIEFKFQPRSYYLGNKISYASSVLLLLLIGGYVVSEIRKKQKEDNS